MTDKYRYMIYPERTYIVDFDGDSVEVQGEDIANIIPEMLRKKYIQACFGYESIPFDSKQEGLVE
jgi:hypothetical protein